MKRRYKDIKKDLRQGQRNTRTLANVDIIPDRFERHPQAFLEATHHPYAPFPGDTLVWNSWVWHDASMCGPLPPPCCSLSQPPYHVVASTPDRHPTRAAPPGIPPRTAAPPRHAAAARRYEGIMRHKVPHGKGTFTVGAAGMGAGLENPSPGDSYEGDFCGGFAHGLGQYKSADGRYIYKGRFAYGLRDGCGMLYDMQPLRDAVARGETDQDALDEVVLDMHDAAQMGRWERGEFREAADEEDDEAACSLEAIGKMMVEADSVVQRARMFAFKPDGDVRCPPPCGAPRAPLCTRSCRVRVECAVRDGAARVQALFYKHHVDGAPMPSNQHPLHYPHGTLFMAPGPAGQTAAVPNDPDLHELMATEVENYVSIHEMYNFDYDPEPDSLLGQALAYDAEQKNLRAVQLAAQGLEVNERGETCAPASAAACCAPSRALSGVGGTAGVRGAFVADGVPARSRGRAACGCRFASSCPA